MKQYLLFLFAFLSCLVAKAEHSYTLWNTLDSGQDYHYTANSHITLTDGFKAEPENGHEVLLDIDAYNIAPPESGTTGGNPLNNTGGVVGSLGGIVDVSQMGGAVYTIPIDLPTGLGGMKPQLAVSYNSQSRNGLLGWGWDLVGISSITRTGQKLYYDGNVNGINYNTDRFCLDGERLLQVSNGDYGGDGTSYRTEQDQMSKIVSYHEDDINGPAFFKVWTADGNILSYGSTNDSKVLKDPLGHVGLWLLSHVEDRNGNCIDYHYITTPDSYRLDRITYSGNNNDMIDPTFSVDFSYSDREDVELSIVGNRICRMAKRLDQIAINNKGSVMYAYQFNYQKPDPSNGLPYHLLTEVTFHAGDEHFNPTRIQWGNNNFNAISGSNLKYQVVTNGITSAFVNAVKFSGDFNGDGYADVIALKPNSEGKYTTANLFINKGVNGSLNFDFVRSFTLSPYISWVQTADMNGDGLDDIVFTNRIRRSFPFPDQIETEIYLTKPMISGGLDFVKQITPLYFTSSDATEALLVGDFLGEGKSVILIQPVNKFGVYLGTTQIFYYDEATDEIQMLEFSGSIKEARLYAADYDGDGVLEILYKKTDNRTAVVKIRKSGDTYYFSEIIQGLLEDWDDCFPGDFNGDGLTDVLLYTKDEPRPWKIHLSQGRMISWNGYELSPSFPYSSPGDYLFSLDEPNHSSQHIKIGDFDGNGCSDIALYEDNFFYVFYGPIKEEGIDAPFTNSHKINIQAFGLYDNMNMCLGNFLGQERLSFLGPNTLSRLPSMRLRHEVKQITNGMGLVTEFTYDYLSPDPDSPSENDFYKLNATGLDHFFNIFCIAVPMRGLKTTTTYNIKGKPVVTRCFYEDAYLHKGGKGFLGFSKTRQEDYCDNQLQKKTLKQYDMEYTDHVVHLALTKEKVFDFNGNLMAQSEYSNTLLTHLHNDKVYMLIADKSAEEYDISNPGQLVKKEIFYTSIDNNYNQYYKYDDIVSITQQIKGTTIHPERYLANTCEYQEISQTSYLPDNLELWLINRPSSVTHTFHREGDYTDVCQQKRFSYHNNKPHLVKSILEIPNDGSHPEDRLVKKTELLYDPTGNITSKTISTPNDNASTRQEHFEYDKKYGRLLLTRHTDAMGHSTAYEYDDTYHFCTSATDCNGLQTRFEQDPMGITCKTFFPDGTQSCKALRWASNSYYQWEKKTGQETKINVFAYTGELTGTKSYDLQGDLIFTDFEYDHLGRISKKGFPHRLGESAPFILYQYDDHNRLNRITHPDKSYETLHYDVGSKSTTYHTTDGRAQDKSKEFNVMNWVIRSTDAEGHSVVYDYQADGKPLSAQVEGFDETRIEIGYDGWGNRIALHDPNYGLITYEYNAFNEIIRQVSPKQDETLFHYDVLGRTVERIENEKKKGIHEITQWIYGTKEGQRGLLTDIVSPRQVIHYDYDPLLRLSQATETIEGTAYHSQYTYDPASRIASVRYPSDYMVQYNYTSEGHVKSIMDIDSCVLWKAIETNALMQPTQFVTGEGMVTRYDYDELTNRLVGIQTIANDHMIQNDQYGYDDFANLSFRKDIKNNIEEHFQYDPLNRLTRIDNSQGISQFSYDPLGRMTSKTKPEGIVFTNADYAGDKPHALKSVQAPHGIFPEEKLDMAYTTFDKVSSISEGNNTIHYDYGYDHQRIRMTENNEGVVRTKTYIGNCEYVARPEGTSSWTILSSPTGTFAVVETFQGRTVVHYIHKDHLGSWTAITDGQGNIEQEKHFDAWGNCEHPDQLLFDRGFTGHEHIKGVNLVNMNGRIYDPLTSSMISPDNNIQMPDFSQNINRYSYCLNNPLTFTDPDGNSTFESILMFYFLYCTDFGYEFQKYTKVLAFHIDLHLSTQQVGIGVDASFGVPKDCYVSYRVHCGASYYWHFFDDSYSGFEFRIGAEWCLNGIIGYSGTSFFSRKLSQTTNSIILGSYLANITYENDYMFNIGKYVLFVPNADSGDRYRSAAARFRFGPASLGINIFTGDPGLSSDDRRTFDDPDSDGRETYTISANGDNPDTYRAGIWYVGIGPIKIGANSEKVRDLLQNKLAHDFLCKGNSPYFKVLNRPSRAYFYFGTETGGTLW